MLRGVRSHHRDILEDDLGFGRIVASEEEVPVILVGLVWSGWAVARSGNAAEPSDDPLDRDSAPGEIPKLEGGRGPDRDVLESHCPGRTPPFLAVKRPACPYKSAIENRFT
jgi:hypothetical protein